MKTGFLAVLFVGQSLFFFESASDGRNMHRIAVVSGVVSKIRLNLYLNLRIVQSLNPRYKSFLELLRVKLSWNVPSLSGRRCIATASVRFIGES